MRRNMNHEELTEYLQERANNIVGTTDLEEANRRYEVLFSWRIENNRFYLEDRYDE